jgi:hypothetical protein
MKSVTLGLATILLSSTLAAAANYEVHPTQSFDQNTENFYIVGVFDNTNGAVYRCSAIVPAYINNAPPPKISCSQNHLHKSVISPSQDIITTVQGQTVLGNNTLANNGVGIWQIDSGTGKLQFCAPPVLNASLNPNTFTCIEVDYKKLAP